MKRIALIKFDDSDNPWMVYKDVGMFLYMMAKEYNWESSYLYFNTIYNTSEWNSEFIKYVRPICLGNSTDYRGQIQLAKYYLREHASAVDVLMLFNYGSTVWKLARLAKKNNPDIIVYSKLDMGKGGYQHFCNTKITTPVKNYFEKIKSRYVDFFSVETKLYFKSLKNLPVFKDKIVYLPNGVSLLDVNLDEIEKYNKENIVITIGRLGDYSKHNELLLEAMTLLPEYILRDWKFYFVGPYTKEFYTYLRRFIIDNPEIKNSIVLTGKVENRTALYSLCKRAKIICMTSRSESVCIAVVEAMYFGAYPVLTNYSDFVWDATNQGKLGYITEHTAKSVSNALRKAIENKSLSKLNIECQKYARKYFNYKSLAGLLDRSIVTYRNKFYGFNKK